MHKYIYEKCEHGSKGGLCIDGGNALEHLSIPIGIIVMREHQQVIPHHYEQFANTEYNTIDDDMFDSLLDRCSHTIKPSRSTRKNTTKQKSNASRKMIYV
jgi:hypothetical protein